MIATFESSPPVAEPPSARLSSREVWSRVLWVIVANRLGVFFFMWIVMEMVPSPVPPGDVARGSRPDRGNLLLDGFFRWDAHWYAQIAESGYDNVPFFGQRDTAFFPFFPLIVHVVSWVTRDVYLAALLVSHTAIALAAFFLFRLAERHLGVDRAARVVPLLLIYPYSFVLSSAYTEATFLAAVTGAFYFAEEGRWVAAGLAASCAGTTRVAGWFVLVGLVLLYLEQRRFRLRDIRWNVLGLALGAVGPAVHLIYLGVRFGDPLLFVKAQGVRGWAESSNLRQIVSLFDHTHWKEVVQGGVIVFDFFHVSMFVVGIAASIWCIFRVRIGYGVWGILNLLVSLKLWASMGRYAGVVFPIFLAWTCLVRSERAMVAWATVCCLYMALLMQCFSHWRYIG
jgi:hypothetical protein